MLHTKLENGAVLLRTFKKQTWTGNQRHWF